MSPRTQAPAPEDSRMWRRLMARAHPDAGGDHDLFVWTGSVKDAVCGGELQAGRTSSPAPRRSDAPPDDKPRVPYPTGADFEAITRKARRMGAAGMPYARVLSSLEDCFPLARLSHEQRRGASYKRLAAIAHLCGMSKPERVAWYRVAESIPLSDRHASHILSKLKGAA